MRPRVRTAAQGQAIKAQIVAAVEAQPMTSREIADAVGIQGCSLGNYFKDLLRAGTISRHEYRKGMYRYYPGQTAPDKPYTPATQKAPPPKRSYPCPVRFVDVSREYFGEAKPIRITMPAAPWEVRA